MRREESSRRDSMKVAQYEVLGWAFKKTTRPGRGRDDRRQLTLVKPHTKGPGAQDTLSSLPLPGRTSLCIISQNFVLGYFSSGPSLFRPQGCGGQAGTSLSAHPSNPYVDAHGPAAGRILRRQRLSSRTAFPYPTRFFASACNHSHKWFSDWRSSSFAAGRLC